MLNLFQHLHPVVPTDILVTTWSVRRKLLTPPSTVYHLLSSFLMCGDELDEVTRSEAAGYTDLILEIL